MLRDEHDVAFTVAKMMDTDLLSTVQDKLTDALAKGETLADFKKALIPTLQKVGWWGKKDVIDPLTGSIVKAHLGSASRLETIFRSNIQSAYSVGHWDKIALNARTAPYLMYDAVDDFRTRPEHAALDGQVHRVDSSFWKTHFPPGGFNCRCGAIQLDDDDLKEMGLTVIKKPDIKYRKWKNPRTEIVHTIPTDVDPGWDHNPGIERLNKLEAVQSEKLLRLERSQQRAVRRGVAAQKVLGMGYKRRLDVSALSGNLTDNMRTLIDTESQTRAAWGKAKPVAIIANEKATKNHADYKAAKGGDLLSAVKLTSDIMTGDRATKKITRIIGNKDPLVVPVHAMEGEGVNVIPLALAEAIAHEHGLRTAVDIVQTNKVGHTGSSGYHRLATPPLFTGDVVAGSDYLIVDDFAGQGSTLANIRGHITLNGGNVIGMVTMTGQRRSATIAIRTETLKALREKHATLEKWWTDVFGYGFELLTESEARYLIRSPDADTIREKIAEAAREGV